MDKINFEDLPSTNTPVDATNLNLLQTNVDNGKVNTTINVTTAGTDLNNYTTDGTWYFNRTNTPSNKPSEVTTTAGYLRVTNRGANETLQEWTELGTNENWKRQKAEGSWGSWKRDAMGEVFENATQEISTNDDLNNYTTPGTYRCPSGTVSQSLSNNPTGNVGFKLIVECTSSPERFRQTIYANRISGDLTYIRHYNGSWGNWYKVTMTQA